MSTRSRRRWNHGRATAQDGARAGPRNCRSRLSARAAVFTAGPTRRRSSLPLQPEIDIAATGCPSGAEDRAGRAADAVRRFLALVGDPGLPDPAQFAQQQPGSGDRPRTDRRQTAVDAPPARRLVGRTPASPCRPRRRGRAAGRRPRTASAARPGCGRSPRTSPRCPPAPPGARSAGSPAAGRPCRAAPPRGACVAGTPVRPARTVWCPACRSLPSVRSRNPWVVSSAASRAVVDFGRPDRRDNSEIPIDR